MRKTALAGFAAAFLLPTFAFAQQVSQERIVAGLGKLQGAAPIVDVELLRQEAMNGSGKEMSGLPNWSKVARLPQMVVEIAFANDSIAIEPESYRTLGMIADALHHPNLWAYKFLVVGHTSSTGSDQHNLELSQQRAEAIKEILSTTFAVDAGRLYTVGVGEYFPIDGSNAKAADNRRVQLYNLGVFTKKQ
ncbi:MULTISPECIES: OmpA family protein [unclassified Rhizobium]|uniref:OmpA family protein n=2 Tax=unclassified Rhizobium TaxID=2613769 RepID=UPI001404A482|nr:MULTISPECIES: OmpA family protein [unclassified Rhizobium]